MSERLLLEAFGVGPRVTFLSLACVSADGALVQRLPLKRIESCLAKSLAAWHLEFGRLGPRV